MVSELVAGTMSSVRETLRAPARRQAFGGGTSSARHGVRPGAVATRQHQRALPTKTPTTCTGGPNLGGRRFSTTPRRLARFDGRRAHASQRVRGVSRHQGRRPPADEELRQSVHHLIDLITRHLGEHREAHDLARRSLRYWEGPKLPSKMVIRSLKV